MMRFFLLLSVLLLFIGCSSDSKSPQHQFVILRQNYTHLVQARGEIYPERETTLSCPQQLQGVIEFMMEPGSPVHKGQEVIRIASKKMENRLDGAKKKLQYNLRKLDRVKKEVEKERLSLDLKVLEKEFAFRLNQIEVERAMGEKDARVIENMNLKILLLEEKVSLLRSRLESFEVLETEHTISTTDMEKLRKNLRVNELKVSLERVIKKEAISGAQGVEKEKLILEQRILTQEWETAKKEREEKLKSLPLKIKKRDLVTQRHRKEIQKIQEILDRATIKSSEDGVFLQAKHPWNGTVITEGTEVHRRMQIGRIVDFNSLQARLRVPEEFADLIGADKKVFMETLSGMNLEGSVTRVQSMATPYNPTDTQSRRFHWAYVEIEPASGLMAGGALRANLEIEFHEGIFKLAKELARKSENGTLEISTPNGKKEFLKYVDIGDFYLIPTRELSLDVLFEGV